MPKTRTIKHDFFLDEDLAKKSHAARILFAGLWLLADRDGRMEDRPQKIKAQIFPYGREDINALLSELSGHFIVRYEIEGRDYIQIRNFKKHQHIHPDEKSNGFPPAPKEIPGNPRKSQEIMHKLYSPDPSSYTDGRGFDQFWGLYPNRVKKSKAMEAWRKLNPSIELTNKIIDALKLQSQMEAWQKDEGQFIPHPTTWLNQRRWEDEIGAIVQRTPKAPKVPSCEMGCGRPIHKEHLCLDHFEIKNEQPAGKNQ